MGLFSRFFGGKEGDDDPCTGTLVANPKIKEPLSLQVLFAAKTVPNASAVLPPLRAYHPSMASAACEIDDKLSQEGKTFGLAGWGSHVIKLVGFDLPMPEEPVEGCVAPSHYPQELKQSARAHQSHVILYYAGYETDPLEQYVALAAVAGATASLGAIVVLNEGAHTSFPAAALSGKEVDGDSLELLRTLPLLLLYCGFVKYQGRGQKGVWMRTFGAHRFGVPDFAALAAGHHEGQEYFDMFESIVGYLRQSGATIAAGHTLQIEQEVFLKFRKPTPAEYFLQSEGELLVAEKISAGEINRK